eukprot:TRINITY_DN4945_c0_g2_i1.p2 TRINITY_DN4945_c0_g2~~TRINITY_DN4945_c0_g2_i1.p2  ORF type:complete len:109 (+),score=36.08 TRINITY_DN4945_c0_g2_i1:60-386(+)
MDIVKKYEAAEQAKDIDAMMKIVIDDVHFETPRWSAKGKKNLKATLKKELADNPKFYDQTQWEEVKPGKKYTRQMKVKLLLGLLTLKVQQTIRISSDNLVKSMIAKKI